MVAPYTVKQAWADAAALPAGKNLRLTFATVRDAQVFRHGMVHARRRDRVARVNAGGPAAGPWYELGTKLVKFPDGSATLEIGRWDGRRNNTRARAISPTRIEVANQERDTR